MVMLRLTLSRFRFSVFGFRFDPTDNRRLITDNYEVTK